MFDADVVKRIVDHMNEDHTDANLLYVEAFSEIGPCDSVHMLYIDHNGMDLECVFGNETSTTRIHFEPPLKDASEARERLVSMVKDARDKLDRS